MNSSRFSESPFNVNDSVLVLRKPSARVSRANFKEATILKVHPPSSRSILSYDIVFLDGGGRTKVPSAEIEVNERIQSNRRQPTVAPQATRAPQPSFDLQDDSSDSEDDEENMEDTDKENPAIQVRTL